MELILLQDVEKLGRKGDGVRVRDGFARNYLLPRKLALPSTRANQAFFEAQKLKAAQKKEKEKAQAQTLAERLAQVKVKLEARSGEHDKLFGSITAEDIAQALKRQGIGLDKKQIHLPEPIRSLGIHTVTLELYPEVKASLQVEVIQKPK